MLKLYGNSIKTCANLNNSYSAYYALCRNVSFKSDLSLDKLYPNSKLNLSTPPPPPQIPNKFNGYIPVDQLNITYSRSSGPGGQNVNCVDTKVDVRFNVAAVSFLSEATKKLLLEEHKNKITKEGFFVLRNDVTRYQQINLATALETIRNIIRDLEKPKTVEASAETLEKHRRKHEKASRERLIIKRDKSMIKANRQSTSISDI